MSGGGFAHDIAGGQGALIIAALKSPNFVHGSAGWSVNKDGSAEFNNGTFRGTITAGTFQGTDFIINSLGTFFYSGTPQFGNLIGTVGMTSTGADSFGNHYVQGDTDYLGGVPGSGHATLATQLFGGAIGWYSWNGTSWIPIAQVAASGPSGAITIGPIPPATAAVTFNGPITATGGTPANPTQISTDSWTAVTTPAGMTGTIRVKLVSEKNMAVLDINVTITSTSTSAVTFTAGSLPSASYYPTGQRQFPVTVNQGTGTAPASPRVNIPTSGAVTLPIPPFAAAGNTCLVSGTVIYPLD